MRFDIEKVKAAADCRTYVEKALGIAVIERSGDWWQFKCPPWRPDSDSGGFKVSAVGFHDHAREESGDTIDLIMRALGVDVPAALQELAEFFHVEPEQEERRIAKQYPYLDVDGSLLYEVLRYEPKDFRQRRPDGQGGWAWNLKGVDRVPYRLPEIVSAPYVIIVEGEQDADTLADLGLPGTCFAQGAGNIKEEYEYAQWFRGKFVVIIPDNDEMGKYHAKLVAWHLKDEAQAVKIVHLPTDEKGDVTDWVRSGGTADELQSMMMATPALTSIKKPKRPEKGKKQPAKNPGQGRGRPKADYMSMAYGFRSANLCDDEFAYRYYREKWHRYDGSSYQPILDSDMNSYVMDFLLEHHPGHVNTNARNQVVSILQAFEIGAIPSSVSVPCWLKPDYPDGSGWLATSSKLIHLNTAAKLLANPSGANEADAIRNPTPELFTTFAVPYEFDPEATCPKWLATLDKILPGEWNQRLARLLFGLSLIPETKYNVCFFLQGKAGTGKNVFMHVLHHVVGENNICCVPLKDFSNRFATWPLTVKLLNVVGEMPIGDGRKDDMAAIEGMLKDVTSGGLVPVEHKGKDRHEAPVIARCIFATNDLPRFYDRSDAIWDRLRILPFNVRLRGTDEDNPDLKNELLDELPGIFNWALMGLADLSTHRLFPEHDEGIAIKQRHREYCDPEGVFLQEFYRQIPNSPDDPRAPHDFWIRSSELYDHYARWSKDNGYYAKAQGSFNKAVERIHNVMQARVRDENQKQFRVYKGLERIPETLTREEIDGGNFV